MVSSPLLLITGGLIDSHSNAHLRSFPAILLKTPCSSSNPQKKHIISISSPTLPIIHPNKNLPPCTGPPGAPTPPASPAGSAPPSVERRSLSPTLAGRSAAGCARGCGAPDTSTCAAQAVRGAETSTMFGLGEMGDLWRSNLGMDQYL